jgi:hypothetical protein
MFSTVLYSQTGRFVNNKDKMGEFLSDDKFSKKAIDRPKTL